MFDKKEIAWTIIAILIFGFIIGFSLKPDYSPYVFLISFVIIATSVLVKKLASYHFSVDINHKIWEFQQYWWYKNAKFKKPVPIGLILPFFLSFFSLGSIKMMAFLQFDGKPSKTRVLKKRGAVRKSEINESDLAFISAWGFWSLILLAIIGGIFKIPALAKFSIYYGIWNLIPIGNLDGAKLFFGSLLNWGLLILVFLISLVLVLV